MSEINNLNEHNFSCRPLAALFVMWNLIFNVCLFGISVCDSTKIILASESMPLLLLPVIRVRVKIDSISKEGITADDTY